MKSSRKICLSGVVFALIAFVGCTEVRTTNLNQEDKYKEMVEKRFVLVVDCYVSEVPESEPYRVPTLSPGIAGKNSGFPLPVSEKNIGFTRMGAKITGIMDKGAVFSVVNVVHRHSYSIDIWDYEVMFEGSDALFSAWLLTDMFSYPPKFEAECATPLD